MIYPDNFPPEVDNPAEKKVYEALSNLPAEGFDIFYQKKFSGNGRRESDDYEIDFLLIDKRNAVFNAVLVIEVKGGNLSYSARNNCWYQNKARMSVGPDDQARKNKYNLIQRFRNLVQDVPVGWLLWFPEGILDTGGFLPTNMSSWQIMDYASTANCLAGIEKAIESIREKHSYYPGAPLETYEDKLKRSLLRGLGIVQPLNILLKQYEDRYISLSESQKSFFRFLYNNKRLAVEGCAGSGKTLLAESAAMDFANEGKNVLLLCFNRMLYLGLKSMCRHENIHVNTFHSFAYEYITAYEPEWYERNKSANPHDFHEYIFPVKLLETLEAHPLEEKFDALIIDEAQDFNEFWLKIIFRLTYEESRIILFYDKNQNIFNRKFNIPESESFFRISMEENFRNTQMICSYTTETTGFELKHGGTPIGKKVEELSFENEDKLISLLNIQLLQLLKVEGLDPEDIVIILEGSVKEHPFHKHAAINDFPLLEWDVNAEREQGAIYYTSISRFKGMESPVVLLVLKNPVINIDKHRLYTQFTRAKGILKVFTPAWPY